MKTFKTFTMVLFLITCAFSGVSRTFNMQELGADVSGNEKCSELINHTIGQASAEGGGTLYFPAGEYHTGAIYMQSNITLHIEAGARLRFSDTFEDYLPFITVRWEGVVIQTFAPLINAHNAENITITGRGTLDGQGKAWWDNKHRLFRPPFIQFYACKNIRIEGVTITNSPFWTVNPEFCDNVQVHGITVINPENAPNTDGVNPSSCSNVRISDCFISVGDDCVTIKSGRDADGRKYGRPCENITITNCVMLSGHGGVVIGSEMSGGVKKISISNCVFQGTDAGIRLKSSRGRGGVVEEIRVDNIVMNGIQKHAFIFDLFYDKGTQPEPVSERTPAFRNIHLSNITGNNVESIGYITGLEEMPVDNISFSNINMTAKTGFTAQTATNIRFHNVDFSVEEGASIRLSDCRNIILDNVRTQTPLIRQAIIEVNRSENVFVRNCIQLMPADLFCKSIDSHLIWGNNALEHVQKKWVKE